MLLHAARRVVSVAAFTDLAPCSTMRGAALSGSVWRSSSSLIPRQLLVHTLHLSTPPHAHQNSPPHDALPNPSHPHAYLSEFLLLVKYKCLEDLTYNRGSIEPLFHEMRPLGKVRSWCCYEVSG